MNNPQIYCSTNLVLLRLGLAEGCAKPSLPIGDDLIPMCSPVLHESTQSLRTQNSPILIGDEPNLCMT